MIKAIAIGASAGGLYALEFLLSYIPQKCATSIFIVQHITADSDSYSVHLLKKVSAIRVKEPCPTEEIAPGTIYIAPPDYHLLIESDLTLTLNCDEKVNFSRPSIDMLFESAADAYRNNLMGILLTGSNADGSKGLLKIQQMGGITIVQNPQTAFMSEMPASAIRLFNPDFVLDLECIGEKLSQLPLLGQ